MGGGGGGGGRVKKYIKKERIIFFFKAVLSIIKTKQFFFNTLAITSSYCANMPILTHDVLCWVNLTKIPVHFIMTKAAIFVMMISLH